MKKILISLIMLTMVFAIFTTVNAATNNTVSITTNKNSVAPGEDVVVTVSYTQAVTASKFKLSFDNTILDYVGSSAGANDVYTHVANTLTVVSPTAINPVSQITFTFKAKAVGTVNFALTGVELLDAAEEKYNLTVGNSKTVEVKAVAVVEEDNNTTNNTNNDTTNNDTANNNTTNNNTNNTKKPTVLPKTGTSLATYITYGVLVALVVSGIYLVNKKRFEN